MLEIVDQILMADAYTWSLSVVLMLCAATMVLAMSESMALTVLYAPVLLAGALTSAWGFNTLGLLSAFNQDIAVIIATSAGMVVTLLPLLGLTRLTGVVHDFLIRAPRHEIIVPRPSNMKKGIPEDRLA